MGISDDKHIVALCGGLTWVRTIYPKVPMHESVFIVLTIHSISLLFTSIDKGETLKDRSDSKGQWPKDPLKFDNSYFV